MAKKTKDARVQVILECTEQKASGVPGISRYVTTKNKKNTPGAKSMVKCIRMDKSPKTGAYFFTEQLVEAEKTKEFFEGKK